MIDIYKIIEQLHAAFVGRSSSHTDRLDDSVADINNIDPDIHFMTASGAHPLRPCHGMLRLREFTIAEFYIPHGSMLDAQRKLLIEMIASAPAYLIESIKEVIHLQSVLGDLQSETGLIERGAAQERKRFSDRLDLEEKSLVDAMIHAKHPENFDKLINYIVALRKDVVGGKPLADPLPMAQANAEVLRLRHALAAIHLQSNQPHSLADLSIIRNLAEQALDIGAS